MASTLASAARTPQASSDVFPRPKMARVTPDDQSMDTFVSSLIFDVVRAHFGKLETAAAEVKKDRSNFQRDMRKLAQLLEGLGPVVCAQVGAGLLREYGVAIETPEQRSARVFDTIESGFKELRQLFQHIVR